MGKVATVALVLLLAGCVNAPIQDSLTFCQGAHAIRPGKGETAKLSDKLVSQIHEHNAVGAKACGWKP